MDTLLTAVAGEALRALPAFDAGRYGELPAAPLPPFFFAEEVRWYAPSVSSSSCAPRRGGVLVHVFGAGGGG